MSPERRRSLSRIARLALTAATAVAVVLLVAAQAAEERKLMDISGTPHSLYAAAYGESIIRVTVKPSNGAAFYQVPHVIVAKEAPTSEDAAVCDGAARTCAFTHGDCVLTARREEGGKGAAAAATSVAVQFTCKGTVLAASTLFVGEAPKAHARFQFPQAKTLYGLAEHAADLPLRQGESYQLWNTDAFEYRVNSTKNLYGSIPFVMAYSAKATAGVLFLNSADTAVVIEAAKPDTAPACDWVSEVGPVDVFFMPGPTPARVQRQHASLTGTSVLPPYFSLGYHQCRWNYLSTKDCMAIDEGFDKHNMPYDVLWLDIEHTNKKKYFTWDTYTFPDPKALTDALASKGRKLVTVKDPHVKHESGYHVYDQGVKGSYFIKNVDGTDYVGDCWPGKSTWPDFYNKRTRDWYASLFHDSAYPGGSRDIHTWVDMNEPSVFKGPQNTMHKEAVHMDDGGKTIEHRYVHNAYALFSVMAVHQGAREAAGPSAKPERPFILTRGFFAGSQRYAAMWNGDNMARWEHLRNTQPELLSLSLSNFPFSGCDVGGFFYETEEELFVRWMQAGVFYPFLRAHAHLETKRREPWAFSEEAQNHLRNALALRYSLIPYLYTVFHHAHRDGDTILRPLIYEFPAQEELREVQDTFLFGPSLLATPVVEKGATEVHVVLPAGTVWYRYQTGEAVQGTGMPGLRLPVQLETIPLFVRGGHVVPVKLRLRRNTAAARIDPFTLLVALNAQGNSYGDLYFDDGATFDYQSGAFAHRQFVFSEGQLRCSSVDDGAPTTTAPGTFAVPNAVERIVVLGFPGRPTSVVASLPVSPEAAGADARAPAVVRALWFERAGNAIVVRKPELNVGDDWILTFNTPPAE